MSKLRDLIQSETFNRFIIAVIILNAIVIGLETSVTMRENIGGVLKFLDGMALTIFIIEVILKLAVYRLSYFKTFWNLFDFSIVAVSLMPFGGSVTVVRAIRIFRAFRLISTVPTMRNVAYALMNAIPAMGSVMMILGLIYYVFSVLATNIFGEAYPEWFGTIGASLYSLFQIMTLESWSMGMVRPIMETHPQAWMVFVPFIIITTFAVVNSFVAIIVNSMQKVTEEEIQAERQEIHILIDEVRKLQKDIQDLKARS
ncbi:ion transporter [Paremcibacter congregatus]|jgi:voltage-gated sodium channel|uniref:ion transporter n=1 Tax=Paremcibacter congregatus TaxID=2043170 RepID=UPI0030ECB82A|tara:strand:+ start:8550 stop:9320 length:771 start_codon:yes stop_codon:yes gene_type:complete